MNPQKLIPGLSITTQEMKISPNQNEVTGEVVSPETISFDLSSLHRISSILGASLLPESEDDSIEVKHKRATLISNIFISLVEGKYPNLIKLSKEELTKLSN